MNKISAKIVADSINVQGDRITSYILTYPRSIHAELMTHRMFSRNAASSRAIPFNKMVENVKNDPFIPIAWQKDHKGMQGKEYFDSDEVRYRRSTWLSARDHAVTAANRLSNTQGVTKQIANRLLEPFLWYTVLVTATEYENFFSLRCPKFHDGHRSRKDTELFLLNEGEDIQDQLKRTDLDWIKYSESGAEIHIQALAESMWDAKNSNTPITLGDGEWHIPFGDIFDKQEVDKFAWITEKGRNMSPNQVERAAATARCARLSYMTFDGDISLLKDIELHDMLLKSRHMSPFEHCARAMSDGEYKLFIKGKCLPDAGGDEYMVVPTSDSNGWCNNFKGFIPYRFLLETGDYD